MKDAEKATAFVAAMAGVEVDGKVPVCSVLEQGDEWEEYNKRYQMFWDMKNGQADRKKAKGGKKGKGYQGKGGGSKKKRDYK